MQQQRQEIESLTKHLAEAKLSGNVEELRRKDQRIRELTEALHQARGQRGDQTNVADLERRNGELTALSDQLRLDLEQAQLAADESQRQLAEFVARTGSQGQQQDNERTRFELEREQLELRIGQLEKALRRAKAEAARRTSGPTIVSTGADRESEQLLEHVQRRRDRLNRVRKRLRKERRMATAALVAEDSAPKKFAACGRNGSRSTKCGAC